MDINQVKFDAFVDYREMDLSDSNHLLPSLEESREAINRMDFSMLLFKLCSVSTVSAISWEPAAAADAIDVYRKWLFLIRKYGAEYRAIPPSMEIDEVWHQHILDTAQYEQDCQAAFGQFMHHFPYFGMRGASDYSDLVNSFEITQQLYLQEYGEPLPSFLSEEAGT